MVAATCSGAAAAGVMAAVGVKLVAAHTVHSAVGVAVEMGAEHSPGVVAEVET